MFPTFLYHQVECHLNDWETGALMRAIAFCNANIVYSWKESTINALHEAPSHPMFFTLCFQSQEDLDKFHALGFITVSSPRGSMLTEKEKQDDTCLQNS